MCAPAAPTPTDPVRAARAQGAENRQTAVTTSQLSNPNIYGPEGSRTVTYNGNIPTITNTLSPEQRDLYNQGVTQRGLLGSLGIQGAEGLRGVFGSPVDFSGASQVGTGEQTRDRVISAMMGRGNEQFRQREDDKNSEMIARGLRPGTEAYDREMQRIDEARNDYGTQVEATAGQEVGREFGMDSARRQQDITEILARREVPLNELIGLLSGSQVGGGGATNTASGGGFTGATVAPANIAGAYQQADANALDVWGNQVNSANQQQAAAASMIGSYITAAM